MPSHWVKVSFLWFPLIKHLIGARDWGLTGETDPIYILKCLHEVDREAKHSPLSHSCSYRAGGLKLQSNEFSQAVPECVGAQVRLIAWHPSKWCSLSSFLTLLEEQLSARERKKKETGSPVQWSQEQWANILHCDGQKMNAGGATTNISVLLDLYFDEYFLSEGMSWTWGVFDCDGQCILFYIPSSSLLSVLSITQNSSISLELK